MLLSFGRQKKRRERERERERERDSTVHRTYEGEEETPPPQCSSESFIDCGNLSMI